MSATSTDHICTTTVTEDSTELVSKPVCKTRVGCQGIPGEATLEGSAQLDGSCMLASSAACRLASSSSPKGAPQRLMGSLRGPSGADPFELSWSRHILESSTDLPSLAWRAGALQLEACERVKQHIRA